MVKRQIIFFTLLSFIVMEKSNGQNIVRAANSFINSLSSKQKTIALYPFESDERYAFHFFPIPDRKGISFDQLTSEQLKAANALIETCLSEQTVKKTKDIIGLEVVLKSIENRKPEDHYRDPGKYFITLFGIPGEKTIWGWRLEGHHISFSFSVDKLQLVSGTPGFLGANPAIVRDGPLKGKQVLKDETNKGFALLHSFSNVQLKKAIVQTDAPADILTFNNRKANIENAQGISYAELTPIQQQHLLQMIDLYVHRYTKIFAENMLKEIQEAGLDKLQFAWAGKTENEIGKPHYYRIHGPTIIIEYDNTQNNGNHVHTVVRDLKRDFGGDLLLQHYKAKH